MVQGRRHWIFLLLPLLLVIFLTACERPLASNDSELTEESVEATVTVEMAAEESAAGAENEAQAEEEVDNEESAEAGAAEQADNEEATEAGAAEEESQAEEVSEEAESADPEVGGGTPETAAEETVESDEETVAEDAAETEETATEDAAETEQSDATESTDQSEEVAESDTSAEETTTDEAAGTESTEEAASEEAAETTEEATAQDSSTLPATHTVAAGENLYRIGLQYGMSWVALAAYNNLPNPNYIRVGQVLKIPGGGQPEPEPLPTPTPVPPDAPGYTDYVVQRGDTLNSIGRKFGVSWVEIAEANGIVNPNLIYAGQVLKIPTSQPETPPTVTHVVQSGESLYRISLQYGVHWLAIAQANHIAPPYVIYAGQTLAIPSG